ncbi:hypothetical protein GDO81_010017 [Engystomops pustulosus]|uniref:Uncharacterized protein n=1 Tax=Engystomops pustulosus TaxID=76066 RepID=A0AAV7BWS0_ENGPU|nr:hypothetical protein GDO81_010017 [Engystomops pustulosus]
MILQSQKFQPHQHTTRLQNHRKSQKTYQEGENVSRHYPKRTPKPAKNNFIRLQLGIPLQDQISTYLFPKD